MLRIVVKGIGTKRERNTVYYVDPRYTCVSIRFQFPLTWDVKELENL